MIWTAAAGQQMTLRDPVGSLLRGLAKGAVTLKVSDFRAFGQQTLEMGATVR